MVTNKESYIPPSDLKGKKLSFEEWWDTYGENVAPLAEHPEQFVWQAAQYHKENK